MCLRSMFIKNCSMSSLSNIVGKNLSWLLETCLYLCLTIYHSLRATNMLQFLMDIDLKPYAKFRENSIKTLARTIYLKFDISKECVPPPCSHPGLLYYVFFNTSLNLFDASFKVSYYRRKTGKTSGENKQNV